MDKTIGPEELQIWELSDLIISQNPLAPLGYPSYGWQRRYRIIADMLKIDCEIKN